jgi:hypothetical protein
MCHPAVGAAIGLFGGVLQGMGASEQRETNAVNYELRADALDRDIQVEKYTSAYEIANTRREVQKTQGNVRAGYAANGLALSGSAADVLTESAIEGDLDVAAIRWNSKNKIKSMRYEQQVYRYNAGQERAGKGLAFVSPILSAGTKFGGSFG